MLERLLAKLETLAPATATATDKRELPDDPDKRDAALRPARLPARIPVTAVDELLTSFGFRALSQNEREEGVDAFAALFWQWGLYRDGRVLVCLWIFGVTLPRAGDWWRARGELSRARAAGLDDDAALIRYRQAKAGRVAPTSPSEPAAATAAAA